MYWLPTLRWCTHPLPCTEIPSRFSAEPHITSLSAVWLLLSTLPGGWAPHLVYLVRLLPLLVPTHRVSCICSVGVRCGTFFLACLCARSGDRHTLLSLPKHSPAPTCRAGLWTWRCPFDHFVPCHLARSAVHLRTIYPGLYPVSLSTFTPGIALIKVPCDFISVSAHIMLYMGRPPC